MIEPFETVSRDDAARPMGLEVARSANRFQVCRVEGSPARTQRPFVVDLHRERAARLAPPANRIENPPTQKFPPARAVDPPGVYQVCVRRKPCNNSAAPDFWIEPCKRTGSISPA